MGKFVVDMAVNVYETMSFFFLFFAIYRFPIRTLLPHMLLSSVILAQTSYVVRFVLEIPDWTPLFMLTWMVILLRFLFRVHFYYSLLLAITGYLGYALIQFSLLLFLQIWFDYSTLVQDFSHEKLLQVGASTITMLLSIFLFRRKLGFNFIPDRSNVTVRMNGTNLKLFIILIVAAILSSSFAYLAYNGLTLALIAIVATSIALLALTIFALRKEGQE